MKISEHCYSIQGLYFIPPWSVNSGFVAGDETTLIIDTGCNNMSAQTIYGYAKCAKPENKIIVINTEQHFDHIGGNTFFRNMQIDIYGHHLLKRNEYDFQSLINYFNQNIDSIERRKANEEQIMFSGCKAENPNIPLYTDTEIDLGSITAKIIFTPGHTDTNLSVYIPRDRVVYTGDTVVNKFIPNLEEGQSKEWNDWLNSLDHIKKLDPEIIVPGHGEYLNSNSEICREIERLKGIITDAIKNKQAPTA